MKSKQIKEMVFVNDSNGKHIILKWDNVENIIFPSDLEELDMCILIGMSPNDIHKAVEFFAKE